MDGYRGHAREGEPEAGLEVDSGAPFGQNFFLDVFAPRVRAICGGIRPGVPVVLIHIAGEERPLDVCHIQYLTPRWMQLAVFRDARSCEDMDVVFVPYETIHRVTVCRASLEDRKMGFCVEPASDVTPS